MFFGKEEGGVAVERLHPGLEAAECCKGSGACRKEDPAARSRSWCSGGVDKIQDVKLNSEMQRG